MSKYTKQFRKLYPVSPLNVIHIFFHLRTFFLNEIFCDDYDVSSAKPVTKFSNHLRNLTPAGNLKECTLVSEGKKTITPNFMITSGWSIGALPHISLSKSPKPESATHPHLHQNPFCFSLDWVLP